ncbi:MAG: hypothetical protein ACT4P6_02190 [Gemmatimonadaceae bacterium]
MTDARAMALDEAEAVLRRLAVVLRQLGADDESAAVLDENGARTQRATSPVSRVAMQPEVGDHAALLGALRRGREVLDFLERFLSNRARSEAA